jgi:hypothetical protein
MRSCLLRTYILLFMLATANIIQAQKDIVINDTLAVNSEKLKVKMGSQGLGKIWKFQFGNYAVISSKAGWTITSSKSNFFNTKTESESTKKFSFLMTNKINDTAKVNAVNNISAQYTSSWLHEFAIFSDIVFESDNLLQKTINFSAYITINGDTSEIWALVMNTISGSNTQGTHVALLTNGERKIFIIPASSNKNGSDTRTFPALGYEFIENGQTISALQYFGGGALGYNKNVVWIYNSLDEKVKLILAAASTAILQVQTDSLNEQL